MNTRQKDIEKVLTALKKAEKELRKIFGSDHLKVRIR